MTVAPAENFPGFTKRERRKLETLLRRRAWIVKRVKEWHGSVGALDRMRAEIAALTWVLSKIGVFVPEEPT